VSIVELRGLLSLGAPVCSSIAIGNVGFRYGFDGVAAVDVRADQAQNFFSSNRHQKH
jgi:hypothetical protein